MVKWIHAQRRAIAKVRPLPPDTVLNLDLPRDKVKTPSKAAEKHEGEAWVRLGMEFLGPEDRQVLILRQWQGLSFKEIGKEIGTSENAARMRHDCFNTTRSIWRLVICLTAAPKRPLGHWMIFGRRTRIAN